MVEVNKFQHLSYLNDLEEFGSSPENSVLSRYWSIQSGIMKVYRTAGPAYAGEPHRLYDIREATCKFETRDMVGIHEPFLGQYQARVRLLLKERSWGPVFLYSKDGANHGQL